MRATYEDLGSALFEAMRNSTKTSLGCPFGNGLAMFLGRCSEEYAEKFCTRGCSEDCYWEMIAENRKTYNHRINILDTQKRMDDFL